VGATIRRYCRRLDREVRIEECREPHVAAWACSHADRNAACFTSCTYATGFQTGVLANHKQWLQNDAHKASPPYLPAKGLYYDSLVRSGAVADYTSTFFPNETFDPPYQWWELWNPIRRFLVAAGAGKKTTVEQLYTSGVDMNARGVKGVSALHAAVRRGRVEVMEFLLSRGADPDISDVKGWTPLYVAAQTGGVKTAEILLSHGADPNHRTLGGGTPLHIAAGNRHGAVAAVLLRAGAQVNATDNGGETPLHWARSPELVEILVEHGAAVNPRDVEGYTPLFRAIQDREAALVRSHIALGADIHASYIQITPMGCIKVTSRFLARGHKDILALLEQQTSQAQPQPDPKANTK